MSVWRVGKKVPVNLYKDDKIAGQCQTEELAAEVVAGMRDRDSLITVVRQLCVCLQDALYAIPQVRKDSSRPVDTDVWTQVLNRVNLRFSGMLMTKMCPNCGKPSDRCGCDY